eukprot:1606732-Prymnesium_polylepis.2
MFRRAGPRRTCSPAQEAAREGLQDVLLRRVCGTAHGRGQPARASGSGENKCSADGGKEKKGKKKKAKKTRNQFGELIADDEDDGPSYKIH